MEKLRHGQFVQYGYVRATVVSWEGKTTIVRLSGGALRRATTSLLIPIYEVGGGRAEDRKKSDSELRQLSIRLEIESLLREKQVEKADAIHRELAAEFWSVENYGATKQEIASELRQSHEKALLAVRPPILNLLYKGDALGADALYESTASPFWPRDAYESDKKFVEAELQRRRRDDERAAVRSPILNLLYKGDVLGADALYESTASSVWPRDAYESDKKFVEAELQRRHREDERAKERKRILSALSEGLIKAADALYASSQGALAGFEYAALRKEALVSKAIDLIKAKKFEMAEMFRLENASDVDPIRYKNAFDKAISEEISARLDSLDVEAADALHDKYPHVMSEAYASRRVEAIKIIEWLDVYRWGSLAELDTLYQWLSDVASSEAYAKLKLKKLRFRLARFGVPLTEEQMIACALPNKHRLIRARAGSGKTRTLAVLTALVIHDQGLDPDQVLVLAFNKKAAQEIGHRICNSAALAKFENARTFHSLAFQLAEHRGRSLLFDDGNLDPSLRKQSSFMEGLIQEIINPAFRLKMYEFFRSELEQIDRHGSMLNPEEYAAYRRSLSQYTLGGSAVKSSGEKVIGDFLFEHGIEHAYEKVWSWSKDDRIDDRPYRPDFTLLHEGRDFVIEHWALDPEDKLALLPANWSTTTEEYRRQIVEKRAFWKKQGTPLIETHAGMLSLGRENFESLLKELLEAKGIECRRLPHEELVMRVSESRTHISRLSTLFISFISRAKKKRWSVEEAASYINVSSDNEPKARVFHQLALRAYAAYEQRLAKDAKMDFDDLLISATDRVKKLGAGTRIKLSSRKSIALRELRWIMIDEFQDFSPLYYGLIEAILEAVPSSRVVAVGDDWQAINGFAGAQLGFFQEFSEHFPDAGTASITVNRRSGRRIVNAGNALMANQGPPAAAHNDFEGLVDVVSVDRCFVPQDSPARKVAAWIDETGRARQNPELARALHVCAEFIVNSSKSDSSGEVVRVPSVLLLSRTARAYGRELRDFERLLESVLRQHPALRECGHQYAVGSENAARFPDRSRIEAMTAHRSKGREANTVIVLEATASNFPKMHADNQLFEVFGVSTADVLAEERRLFYVAVTRSEKRLLILTESGKESPFIEALSKRVVDSSGLQSDHVDESGERLKRHLRRIGGADLLLCNVSPAAADAAEKLLPSLGFPAIGFELTEGACAEVAWPGAEKPVAVLSDASRSRSKLWTDAGWEVI